MIVLNVQGLLYKNIILKKFKVEELLEIINFHLFLVLIA